MAWRSSGTTNDEMVDKLKRFGVISSSSIESAFRLVDRALFLPESQKSMAYTDQPIRTGTLHASAPHIYGSVLEALELRPDSSMSFLNVGSGTGYMSAIVASILGAHSNNYGVEIYPEVVEHAKSAVEYWKSTLSSTVPHIEWVCGNALHINVDKGEAAVGFDRIYVGASVDKEDLPKLAYMLKPGGILVGPVEDELVKVVRIGSRSKDEGRASSMMDTDDSSLPVSEFSQHVLSGVRFASLLNYPPTKTVLPSRVWNPSVHHQYPDSFRNSCREILLCSNASQHQSPPPKPFVESTVNAAGLLPGVLWMEILSYTHRDWFETPQTELEFLRRRLAAEQEATQQAHQARREAEARCQLAEEERDVYKVLARRYQQRLEAVLRRNGRHQDRSSSDVEEEDEENAGERMQPFGERTVNERSPAIVFGLGAMLRSIRNNGGGEEEEEEDDDIIDEDDSGDAAREGRSLNRNEDNQEEDDDDEDGIMEEDASSSQGDFNATMADPDSEEDSEEDSTSSDRIRASYFPLIARGIDMHQSTTMVNRPQKRTVSITSEDL